LSNSDLRRPSGFYKELEAIERVAKDSDLELEKRYKKLSQRLQVGGLVVAVLTIMLMYWNIRLQASNVNLYSSNVALQSSLSTFEKNQRVVEMSINLADFWGNQLDPVTRYRGSRFLLILKSLNGSPQEQKNFVSALLDQSELNPESISNQHLLELIDPKFSPVKGANPSFELSGYKSALIKILNTMEAIANVKRHTLDNPEAQRVLESAYAGAIKQRYRDLSPFVEAYRERTNDGRKQPAWQPIDEMVNGV